MAEQLTSNFRVGGSSPSGDAQRMKRIELLQLLENSAKSFRVEAINSIKQNNHLTQIGNEPPPSQTQIDAVLTGFINHVAVEYGVDLGLKATDLQK